MATLQIPEAEVAFTKSVSSFAARFGKNDDQVAVTENERKKRQETAAEGADLYFDFATNAYENGWCASFHYGPFAPGETLMQAMAFYEHRFAHLMGLKPGTKVLDVGCGIGGPAREIAKLAGCEIVGIAINQHQVDRAKKLTAEAGLEHQCVFMKADYLALPFPTASFDAAYAIEATCHAPSLAAVYAQIARVLKPNAVFASSEWLLTPTFDPTNTAHIGIRNRIERGNAISNLHGSDVARSAFIGAFDIFHDEDFALHWTTLGRDSHRPEIPGFAAPPDPSSYVPPAEDREKSKKGKKSMSKQETPPVPTYRPWYYLLTGDTKNTIPGSRHDYRTALMMTKFMRRLFLVIVRILEHVHLYPQGTLAATKTLAYCVDGVVEGGCEGIFTPCWWFIGHKRESPTDTDADAYPDPVQIQNEQAIPGLPRPKPEP